MYRCLVEKGLAGQRLDRFLARCLPKAPVSFFYKMLRRKNITLNGKRAQGGERLKEGDEIRFFLSRETLEKFSGGDLPGLVPVEGDAGKQGIRENAPSGGEPETPGPMEKGAEISSRAVRDEALRAYHSLKGVRILYEDGHALILHKPSGILTQRFRPGQDSLNEWLIGYLLESGAVTDQSLRLFRPSVCNRLDRNTSGLVLCGKTLAGSQALSRLIRDRRIRKFYRTVCGGRIEAPGRLEGALTKDRRHNRVQISDGEGILTAYRPLALLGSCTYLEVELITGKTHQIRAHLARAGHPLIGDRKYGNPRINQAFPTLSCQLLHACRVEFPPLEGALEGLSGRQVVDPLPEEFKRILEGLTDGHMEFQRS